MTNYSLQEIDASVWGDAYRATTPNDVLKCGEKRQLLQTSYPFLDHYRFYTYKPKNQRAVKESQTFLVSYVYVYDDFIGEREEEFREKLRSISSRFYKEPCLFREKNAYRIFILDTDVDIDAISLLNCF